MKILIILCMIISNAWAQKKENFSQEVKNDIEKINKSKSKDVSKDKSKYDYKEHEGRFPASVLQDRMEEYPDHEDRPEPKKLDENFRQVTPTRW